MTDQFLADLRDEVAAAACRADLAADPLPGAADRPPRPRRLLSAAAAVLLVVVLAATFLLRTQPGDSAVRVERDGNSWVFRWDEPGPDPDELEQLVQELGLDMEILEQPTGAYKVGRVVGGSMTGRYLPDFGLRDEDGRTDDRGFRLPTVYDGAITIHLGRLGRDGERWDVSVPATGPGAPLACKSLLGAPLRETLAALEDTDVQVEGLMDMNSTDPLIRRPSERELQRFADRRVWSLEMSEPDVLWISIIDEISEQRPIAYPEGC